MADPFQGAGGGIWGEVCTRLIKDAGFNGYLQGRVRTSRFPPKTAWPWACLAQVSGTLARESDGMVLYTLGLQLSIYVEGFNAARLLGRMASGVLLDHSRGPYVFDNQQAWLIPKTAAVLPDPSISEDGLQVWHAMRRYETVVAE